MPTQPPDSRRAHPLVQLYRRDCGGLAYKPDRLPLHAGEMLIGRGLEPAEAIAFICEQTAGRAPGADRDGDGS